MPEQALVAVVSPHLVGGQIPLKKCVVGRLGHQPEAFYILPQYFLDFPAAADVLRYQNAGLPPCKLHPKGDEFDFDWGAVLFSVAPHTQIVGTGAKVYKRGRYPLRLFRRAQVREPGLEELFARSTLNRFTAALFTSRQPHLRVSQTKVGIGFCRKGGGTVRRKVPLLRPSPRRWRIAFRHARAAAPDVEQPRPKPREHCAATPAMITAATPPAVEGNKPCAKGLRNSQIDSRNCSIDCTNFTRTCPQFGTG